MGQEELEGLLVGEEEGATVVLACAMRDLTKPSRCSSASTSWHRSHHAEGRSRGGGGGEGLHVQWFRIKVDQERILRAEVSRMMTGRRGRARKGA
eukprot:764340-Hanusia_phi.AAC.6